MLDAFAIHCLDSMCRHPVRSEGSACGVCGGVGVVLSPWRGQSCQEGAVLQVRGSEEESERLALSPDPGLIKTRTNLSLFEGQHLGQGSSRERG